MIWIGASQAGHKSMIFCDPFRAVPLKSPGQSWSQTNKLLRSMLTFILSNGFRLSADLEILMGQPCGSIQYILTGSGGRL